MTKKILLAYVPVIHQGYFNFFNSHKDLPIFVFDKDLTNQFRPLEKDIRALHPSLIVSSLAALGFDATLLNEQGLKELNKKEIVVVMPDEDFSHMISEKYLQGVETIFESVFLRWDTKASLAKTEVSPDAIISEAEFDKQMIAVAEKESEKSSDFWRHIGGLVVKDGKIVLKRHNCHVPTEQNPYVVGDSRGNFGKGDHVELTMALHAEIGLVAEAAKKGISLDGASMYVTTFPCPPCAKAVAYSGVKKLYYCDGYGMLDGEEVLRSQGVEIIKVKKD